MSAAASISITAAKTASRRGRGRAIPTQSSSSTIACSRSKSSIRPRTMIPLAAQGSISFNRLSACFISPEDVLRLPVVALALVAIASPAAAQSWKEYSFTESGFAAQYPGKPVVEERPYKTAYGGEVKERVYVFNAGGVDYVVAVAYLSRRRRKRRKSSMKRPKR